MKLFSWLLIIVGVLIILNGAFMSSSSAIHQIYSMLNVLTGFVIFYCGLIFPKICFIADKLKAKEEKEAEEIKYNNAQNTN